MIRRYLTGLMMATVMLVAGGLVSRGQEPPKPPDPPAPPEPAQIFLLNASAVHLGVTLNDVTAEKARALKLPAVAGAIVSSVQKDSAAAKAGIQTGDTITEFDGIRVRSSAELRRLVRETPAGRTVAIKVVRDGKTHILSAKLEASPHHYDFTVPDIHVPPLNIPEMPFIFGSRGAVLGISADDLTPQLAQYFGVTQGKGVLIAEVTKGGAADKAGLKAGDVIVAVDGKPVSGVEELRAALNDNFTGDTRRVSLTIVRDRHTQTVNADLTRRATWEKRTSRASGQDLDRALAELRAQARQQRAQAAELRMMADQQRAQVRADVIRQQQRLREEWQRQMREQMLVLRDQLRQMSNQLVTRRQYKEI